jgi:hypothetical protein
MEDLLPVILASLTLPALLLLGLLIVMGLALHQLVLRYSRLRWEGGGSVVFPSPPFHPTVRRTETKERLPRKRREAPAGQALG